MPAEAPAIKSSDNDIPLPSDSGRDPQPGDSEGLSKMADAFVKLGGDWLQSQSPNTVPLAKPEPAKEQPAEQPPAPKQEVKVEPAKPKDPFDFAKPEVKKPTEQPVKTEPEEIKSSAAREKFRMLEADRDAHMKRADELEAKYKAIEQEYQKTKAKTVDVEAVEMLRKENEELSKRINVLDVTQHPKFQQYFGGKEKQIVDQIRSASGPELANTVVNLLRAPDTQERANMLAETISQLPVWSQNKITNYAIQLDQLNAERDAAIAESGKAREVMLLENESRQKAERQQVESNFNRVVALAQDPKNGLEVLIPKDGDEAHNASVKAAIERARSIVNNELDTPALSQAALWAAAAPMYRDAMYTQAALIAKLEAQIKATQAATPSLSGKASEPSSTPEPSGFQSKFMEAFNSLGMKST